MEEKTMINENSQLVCVKPGKLQYLEGMRALMAINVIFCHFICVYYPMMYLYNSTLHSKTFLRYFSNTPLSALVNGSIAVSFFFVLTGFLVGLSVFSKTNKIKAIENKSVNRYLRLLPIIAITTLFTYLTMKLNLQRHLLITDPKADLKFLSGYCNFNPTLTSVIKNMFLTPFLNASDYVGPFWTIKFEFWGYILTLIIATIFKESKWRRVWYIGLSLLFSQTIGWDYVVFMLGLFVADIKFNLNPTVFNKYYEKVLSMQWFRMVCFILGTFLACLPMINSSIYQIFNYIPINSRVVRGSGLALFLFVSLDSKIIQKILSWKPLVYLGSLSFETYALHWPLMLTVEAGLFLWFRTRLSYDVSALLAFVITIVVIYVASILLNLFIRWSGKLLVKGIKKIKKEKVVEKQEEFNN